MIEILRIHTKVVLYSKFILYIGQGAQKFVVISLHGNR